MTNIYQQIYDLDLSESAGLPAFPSTTPPSTLPPGHILVSENVADKGSLFTKVKIPASKQKSYDLARALFDNYEPLSSVPDEITVEEAAEIDDLLEHVIATSPMRLARSFIERETGRKFTDAAWYASVRNTWFTPFAVGSSPTRSGFEHVFLGEWKAGSAAVGGLHWWYYYVMQAGKMDYDGARYGQNDPGSGLMIPEIATMTFEWNVGGRRLRKKIGGFLVGVSVEGLMAMGMVCAADVVGDVFVLQGAEIQWKMFKSPDGRSVNTFYPVYRRAVVSTFVADTCVNGGANGVNEGVENGRGGGQVRILSVVANPAGLDQGREKVTVMSVGETVNLKGWRIVGPNKSFAVLGDVELEGGEARTFTIPARGGLQLGNSGGTIKILNTQGGKVHSVQYSSKHGGVQGGILHWRGEEGLVLLEG